MNLEAWLANLASYAAQVGVLALAASSLPWVFRVQAPRVLLAYWRILLAACLLLPLIQPWRHERVEIPAANFGSVVFSPAPAAPAPAAARFSAGQAAAAVLALGLAARLVFLSMGLWRLRWYRRRGWPLKPLPDRLAELRAWLGPRTEILVSNHVTSPVTFGLLRPVILLPPGFTEMDSTRQAAIVCHELLHVQRRDWLFVLAEEIIRSVLWFHPAIWWLLGRIQLAREQVVDREAVELTGAPRPYVGALLEVAAARRCTVAALAPLFLKKKHFTERVKLILEEVRMSRFRLVVSVSASAVLLVAAGAAAVRAFPLEGAPELITVQKATQESGPRPAAQDPPSKIRVGGGVQQKKLIKQVPPIYPPLAKQARIQGTVRLTAILAKDGTVKDVQLVSGHPLLVPPALEAVRQWHYEPTLLNGQPVEVVTQVDVNFKLEGVKAGEEIWPEPSDGSAFPRTPTEKGVRRIQVAGADQTEKLIHGPAAAYPPLAQQAGVGGVVRLRVLIEASGAVKEARPFAGHPLLIPPALEAVRNYRYRATTVDGQPAEVVTEVEVKVPPGDWPAPAAPPEETYKVGGDVTAPKLIHKVEPQYSQEARDAKLMGKVVLAVEVWPDGRIHNAVVKEGLGLGLDEKAIEAVKQWQFVPASIRGKPVKVAAIIEINFRLD
jgi:TonB family protein